MLANISESCVFSQGVFAVCFRFKWILDDITFTSILPVRCYGSGNIDTELIVQQ
jgi:hypothetical protein